MIALCVFSRVSLRPRQSRPDSVDSLFHSNPLGSRCRFDTDVSLSLSFSSFFLYCGLPILFSEPESVNRCVSVFLSIVKTGAEVDSLGHEGEAFRKTGANLNSSQKQLVFLLLLVLVFRRRKNKRRRRILPRMDDKEWTIWNADFSFVSPRPFGVE